MAIQAEIGGRIVAVRPDLVEGDLIKKGDLLVSIEQTDYQLAVQKAEANVLTAQSALRIEEGQQAAVRHELELMGGEDSDVFRDLTLREPQLKAAEASVRSAELALQSARKNLERSLIKAPFSISAQRL